MAVEMHEICCCECGMVFMVTNLFNNLKIASKKGFYCPNGHFQGYEGETDKQKLESTKRFLANAESREAEAKRSNSALRGVITRMKKKAAAAPERSTK